MRSPKSLRSSRSSLPSLPSQAPPRRLTLSQAAGLAVLIVVMVGLQVAERVGM